MPAHCDALVVGAGPVGLAAAVGLARCGLSVRIIDRSEGPKAEPRAAVIWSRGAEALHDLGVGRALKGTANLLAAVHFHGRGRLLGTAQLGHLASAYPTPLLVEQHVTEHVLADRLRDLGVRVEWGVEFSDLTGDSDGVTVTHISRGGRPDTLRCAWLIGCDGARSRVRERCGIGFPGGPVPNLQLLQVDATPRWRHERRADEGHYFLASGACLGCFPIADGAYRFFCYAVDPDPGERAPLSLVETEAMIARVARVPELRLERATWFNRARFQKRMADRLRVGRVLLAGDAAHVWPSLGGHGMDAGLRGAHNLAWKLAAVHRREAPDALLDSYEVEQRASVRRFLRSMHVNFVERPSSTASLPLRERALSIGLRFPGLVRRIERAVGDLDHHHRGGPLANVPPVLPFLRRGPRAGDRLPDGMTGPSGRLHDLLDYRCWTLFVPPCLSAVEETSLHAALAPWIGRLQLRAVLRQAASDLRESLVLVRPDRFIAVVADRSEAGAVARYLSRWLQPPRGTDAAQPTGNRLTPLPDAAVRTEDAPS